MASTRGRGGTGWDITESVRMIMEDRDFSEITDSDTVVLWGELYVSEEDLEYLRVKYLKDFKTTRSAAVSLARVPVSEEDKNILKLALFESSVGDLAEYEKMGFRLAPNIDLTEEDIDEVHEDLNVVLEVILDHFWDEGAKLGIPSDGVVAELSDVGEKSKRITDGKYDAHNIAIKVGPWEADVYTSVVEDIILEQQKEEISVVLKVRPVMSKIGATLQRVNAFNLGILINSGIEVGSTIRFEYKSETNINLIYKGSERDG